MARRDRAREAAEAIFEVAGVKSHRRSDEPRIKEMVAGVIRRVYRRKPRRNRKSR